MLCVSQKRFKCTCVHPLIVQPHLQYIIMKDASYLLLIKFTIEGYVLTQYSARRRIHNNEFILRSLLQLYLALELIALDVSVNIGFNSNKNACGHNHCNHLCDFCLLRALMFFLLQTRSLFQYVWLKNLFYWIVFLYSSVSSVSSFVDSKSL